MHTFLDGSIRRVIERCQKAADNGDGIENYDVQVLKLLYLIRYVDDVKANLDNIVILMADDIRTDKIELRAKLQKSLDRLKSQNYIDRRGDTYVFLTDEEQDIAREISNTSVDTAKIVERIGQMIFGDIYTMMKGVQYDRRFLRRSDEKRNPDIPQPHIYAIRESNHLDNYVVEQFVGGNAGLKKDMGTLIAELHDAKEFGSILNVSQVNFEGLYKRFAECKTEISMWQIT